LRIAGLVVVLSVAFSASLFGAENATHTRSPGIDGTPEQWLKYLTEREERMAALNPGCAGEPFPENNVQFRSRIPMSAIPGTQTRGAAAWGYTSPSGRRYGIMGFNKGTAFIEVTNPDNPVLVEYISGNLPPSGSIWREMRTYGDHCYVVSDGTGVGMQVIDLGDIDNDVVTHVTNSNIGSGLTTSHTIAVNEQSGYAYLIGSNIGGGKLAAVSLANPDAPVLAGNWTTGVFSHDALVVSYNTGPLAGREIAYVFAYSNGMYSVDVTDKSNMFTMDNVTYPNVDICHSGWLTEDRRYMYIGDEGDEDGILPTTTYIVDVSDPSNMVYVKSFTTGLPSIDHNMMVRGNYLYCSNYSSGLHVWNIYDPLNPVYTGSIDTHPQDNGVNFDGTWGNYVGWPGSIVFLADRDCGAFVLDAQAAIAFPVPAIGSWGMAVLALVLILISTILFRFGRQKSETA